MYTSDGDFHLEDSGKPLEGLWLGAGLDRHFKKPILNRKA